ncbi:hypothetical protein ANCCAN_07931 [Ancylostoma caninum]|uniref:Uncharacterized protein n=1 Tax=Ancylostoma caninum TaxID=29170 RepID=A0A368GSU9_ANCCA|nr:hypothetical protein ANCCAN_07931 [Ancylostoma caninum]
MILVFLIAFFVNVIQVLYSILFDRHSPSCKNVSFLFGKVLCISSVLPLQRHSSFASGLLALFHLILTIIAIAVAASYSGSISEIVESTDPAYFARSRRRRRRHGARSQGVSRRHRHSQGRVRSSSKSERVAAPRQSQRSPVVASSAQSSSAVAERKEAPDSPKLSRYTKLDITKLPDGTRFKTTDNKGFNMEYYVENGVFVGSGTETLSKTISICAPIRPQRPREQPEQVCDS